MDEKVYSVEEYNEKEIKPKQLIEIEIAKLLGLNVLGWADCCDAYDGIICAQEEHGRGDWCLGPVCLGRCDCELFDKDPEHLSFRDVPKFLGHYGSCMEEVPHYARDLDSTMIVVNTLDNISIRKDHISGKHFYVEIRANKCKELYTSCDESLPLAICECFLRFKNGTK